MHTYRYAEKWVGVYVTLFIVLEECTGELLNGSFCKMIVVKLIFQVHFAKLFLTLLPFFNSNGSSFKKVTATLIIFSKVLENQESKCVFCGKEQPKMVKTENIFNSKPL